MNDVEEYEAMCLSCRAGLPDEGDCTWTEGGVEDLLPVCPWATGHLITVQDYQVAQVKAQVDAEVAAVFTPQRREPDAEALQDLLPPPAPAEKGDSGYVDPAAWPSTRDIGTLADPESVGRKRVKRMFPIQTGQVCEWAGLEFAGGGITPIRGCLNNPASDWHHGPDKNTLNNAKRTRGVGEYAENVHIICAFCHNTWHGANDPSYGPYDRIAQQQSPWYPEPVDDVRFHDTETRASLEDLLAAEKVRRERYAKTGHTRRGRGAIGSGADTNVVDEGDE